MLQNYSFNWFWSIKFKLRPIDWSMQIFMINIGQLCHKGTIHSLIAKITFNASSLPYCTFLCLVLCTPSKPFLILLLIPRIILAHFHFMLFIEEPFETESQSSNLNHYFSISSFLFTWSPSSFFVLIQLLERIRQKIVIYSQNERL